MQSKYYIYHSLLVVALIVTATTLMMRGPGYRPINISTGTIEIQNHSTSTMSSSGPSSQLVGSKLHSTNSVSVTSSIPQTVTPIQQQTKNELQRASSTPTDYPLPTSDFPILSVGTSTYTLNSHENETLMEAMRALSTISSFTFDGHEYTGLGFFVTTINGKKAADGFNWMLYVNGTPAEYGASSFIIKNKQLIEWRYEK